MAVDPCFKFAVDESKIDNSTSEFLQVTSDEFFASCKIGMKFDLVFLDGLHTWDQTYKDFCNALLHTHDRSIIIIDDIWPDDVFSCHRDYQKAVDLRLSQCGAHRTAWHGDTYKVIPMIRTFHPTIDYCTIKMGGNCQTITWRSPERSSYDFNLVNEKGLLNTDSLDYLWFIENLELYRPVEEDEAFLRAKSALCSEV